MSGGGRPCPPGLPGGGGALPPGRPGTDGAGRLAGAGGGPLLTGGGTAFLMLPGEVCGPEYDLNRVNERSVSRMESRRASEVIVNYCL